MLDILIQLLSKEILSTGYHRVDNDENGYEMDR